MAKSSSGGNWVTINGVHVLIGANGAISKGPAHLVGKTLDSLSSNAPRTSGNQAKSTRLEDYSSSVSLMSAKSEMKKYKKEVAETKKEESSYAKSKKKTVEKSIEYVNATPERQAQLMREAEKVGMTYTSSGYYTNAKKYEAQKQSMAKATQTQKTYKDYEKKFKEATTDAERSSLIKEARSKNINLNSNGVVTGRVSYYSTPQQIVTIRGVKLDLSITSARKEAIKLSATFSQQGKENFAKVLMNLGYDPITGKPL